jgi:serine/threonine-protein phosphatase 5
MKLKFSLAHDFKNAARLYSDAIEKNPSEPTLWCNRAYARMKLEEYGYALSDASAFFSSRIYHATL